jgi:Adenylate and Guanylate cyclase catalytic domain
MTRFAHECIVRMSIMTKQLEATLGPCVLQGRCGLHSGPVTAGVLRGEKARFQLFGDTMNTASRIETSGVPGKVHISHETAVLLQQAGKAHWVVPRDHVVSLKGKGEVQTFFAYPKTSGGTDRSGTTHESDDQTDTMPQEVFTDNVQSTQKEEDQMMDLVTHCVEVLHNYLFDIAKGGAFEGSAAPCDPGEKRQPSETPVPFHQTSLQAASPSLNTTANVASQNGACVPETTRDQLQDFVLRMAHLHPSVPAHSFNRACEVLATASQFVTAIMACPNEESEDAATLHDASGIRTDPLMRFALVLTALILDIEQCGLPSDELVPHDAAVASGYGEQNEATSLDIAWKLLTEGPYEALRNCICRTKEQMQRLRVLLEIAVKAAGQTEKGWHIVWNQRLSAASANEHGEMSDEDCQAMLVFGLIIQASRAAHCWKTWTEYRTSSAHHFEERYVAWTRGLSNDPTHTWYEEQLGFFDGFLIPLAESLGDVRVLGAEASVEYLDSAKKIRAEWEQKGKQETAEMLAHCRTKYPVAQG